MTELVHLTGENGVATITLDSPTNRNALSAQLRREVYRSVALEALVRMKLTSYRRKDQVHLEDMLGVGLIDASWVSRFPPELGARLQHLIDTPDG